MENTEKVLNYLNELVKIDPYAIAELLCIDVVCNEELSLHPTVPVMISGFVYHRPGTYRVNMLGILNGFCGVNNNGYPPIEPEYSDGKLIGFKLRD